MTAPEMTPDPKPDRVAKSRAKLAALLAANSFPLRLDRRRWKLLHDLVVAKQYVLREDEHISLKEANARAAVWLAENIIPAATPEEVKSIIGRGMSRNRYKSPQKAEAVRPVVAAAPPARARRRSGEVELLALLNGEVLPRTPQDRLAVLLKGMAVEETRLEVCDTPEDARRIQAGVAHATAKHLGRRAQVKTTLPNGNLKAFQAGQPRYVLSVKRVR